MEISGQGVSGQVQGANRFIENTPINNGKQPMAADGKNMLLNSLEPGSYLYGQVQSSNEEGAVLLLENGQKLLARLMDNVSLTPGQNVTLQVVTKQDGLVYMKPLFAEAALEMTAGKALKEAGFMNTPKNLEIVKELLEHNMPVDKNTIRSMLQKSVTNPDIPVKQLALLEKLGIPATKENLEQLKQYQANEHSLGKQMDGLIKELGETTKALLLEGKTTEAAELNQKVLDFLYGELTEEGQEVAAQKLNGETAEGKQVGEDPAAQEMSGETERAGAWKINGAMEGTQTEALEIAESSGKQSTQGKAAEMEGLTQNPERAEILTKGLGESVAKDIGAQEGQLGLSTGEGAISETEGKAAANVREQMFSLKSALERTDNPEDIQRLLGSSRFQKILERGMRETWQIKASEFTGKDTINRSYARMEEQVRILGELLKESGIESEAGMKNIANVQQNLEFMQDLNQVFPYIQLPLQMAGENAHGDLYVFRDKKQQHEQGEPFTAFLHLSMEHLGDVDVYLSLKEQSVSTDITVEKEEVLDLFEAHIEELTGRLEEKGYQVRSSLKINEKKLDFAEDILARQAGSGTVSRFSFDVKA